MLLAIDIGNTHTVVGAFNGEKLAASWRINTIPARSADETWMEIGNLALGSGVDVQAVRGMGISSVVPACTATFETLAGRYLRVRPVIVTAGLDLGITVRYDDPATIGADRLCNAVAAFAKYGGPLIVVDLGTATTFDVVSAGGEFLGGAITLGMAATAAGLHRMTAQLPLIALNFPQHVIARNTVSAMQAGVMFGAVDALEGIIMRIQAELGGGATVVGTGGLSNLVGRRTTVIDHYEPSLVLDGVRLICERNAGGKRG